MIQGDLVILFDFEKRILNNLIIPVDFRVLLSKDKSFPVEKSLKRL